MISKDEAMARMLAPARAWAEAHIADELKRLGEAIEKASAAGMKSALWKPSVHHGGLGDTMLRNMVLKEATRLNYWSEDGDGGLLLSWDRKGPLPQHDDPSY